MDSEAKKICEMLLAYPEGLGVKMLHDRLAPDYEQRTLLRKLNGLIEKGVVLRFGKGRETVYQLSHTRLASDGPHFSQKSQAIQAYVNSPLEERREVKYQATFLESYTPNSSFYLDEQERGHLAKLGRQNYHDAVAGTFARKIMDRFLIDLSWNSSRLEGNTYSILETEQLFETGGAVQGKSPLESQMLINHKAAIEFLVDASNILSFDEMTICNLHALLSDGLLGDPSASGRLRDIVVGIHRTRYAPLEIPQQIEDYFTRLLEKIQAIKDPFEQAFFALVQFPYLQPFQDVNKRVSRLAANIPFIRQNICPISFVGVDEKAYIDSLLGVYELNQVELLKEVFIGAYELSVRRYADLQVLLKEPDPLRVKYRKLLYQLVHGVIMQALGRSAAVQLIKRTAEENIDNADRSKFIELVEVELSSLHIGNFARYRVTPKQFEQWRESW